MSTISGTGISLSSSYYLRNFYVSNRDATSSSKRKEMTNSTLSKADADALHRAARKLRNFNFSDDTTDGANIYASVTAFVEVYNNTLTSSTSSSDSSLERYAKYLKNLSKEYTKELKDVGITVNSDGSLSANDNLLKSAKVSDMKKLFSQDAEYGSKVSRYAKRMTEKAENLLFTEQTGIGSYINLTL